MIPDPQIIKVGDNDVTITPYKEVEDSDGNTVYILDESKTHHYGRKQLEQQILIQDSLIDNYSNQEWITNQIAVAETHKAQTVAALNLLTE